MDLMIICCANNSCCGFAHL